MAILMITIVVLAALAVLVTLAVRKIHSDQTAGRGCGGNCSGCGRRCGK